MSENLSFRISPGLKKWFKDCKKRNKKNDTMKKCLISLAVKEGYKLTPEDC